ncbi:MULTISPECIES: DUF2147 domain-containing protein [unclassified Novosphingobium]|uniref:DUF2147 domain-containing protein n=2 Tax=unclassified Novosphingobium TaxID=2644732 RepID=UPI00135C9E0A|nr:MULTISPECIES: DUF2147 domain-containing protein [unclassified Novosphingobium]
MHVMKPLMLALVAAAPIAMIGLSVPAVAADADSVLGTWRTPSKNGVVEIARCGGSICGKLMSSDHIKTNPELKDINNKDTARRDRKLKGLQIVGGFKLDDGVWTGGSIYNPEDGGTYKATITPAGPDSLKLKGCIVWPLCKTQTWNRIK